MKAEAGKQRGRALTLTLCGCYLLHRRPGSTFLMTRSPAKRPLHGAAEAPGQKMPRASGPSSLPFHPSLPSKPKPSLAPPPRAKPKPSRAAKPKRQERVRSHSAQTWLADRKTESYRSNRGYSMAEVKTSSTGWQGSAIHATKEGKSLRSDYLRGILPDVIQSFMRIPYQGQVPSILRSLS
jgi:hypothetical protein